jgi:xanthine dehydrogenase accessory factor
VIDPIDAAGELLERRESGALVTHLETRDRALMSDTGEVLAGHIDEVVLGEVRAAAIALIRSNRSGTVSTRGGEVFVEAVVPSPRLLIFGAGPIAEALCAMATSAGFAVEVGDPRPAFAQASRFPAAVAVKVGWPAELVDQMAADRSSYAVSLLHEARFESELLPALLRSPVGYIGALGSKRTHAARIDRLESEGFSNEDIARIHGPVGLGIGAVTPEEIAVSIVAQLVSIRRMSLASLGSD